MLPSAVSGPIFAYEKKVKKQNVLKWGYMTENQSNYLADLATTKGVILKGVENVSQSWASAKIEELQALPDAPVEEVTPELDATINKRINGILGEMKRWNFQG